MSTSGTNSEGFRKSKNILLVKLSSMGDVVHSFPALTEAADQGYRFDWVVEEAFVDLAKMHPAIDRVIPFSLRRWRKQKLRGLTQLGRFVRELRGLGYDQVLDAQGLIKSSVVARLSGASKRMGLDSQSAREPASARFYTEAQSVSWDLHAIDRLRLLFGRSLGYKVDLSTPAPSPFSSPIPETSNPAAQTVLVHGTTWRSKEYPEVAWRSLIERLVKANHSVAMLSGSIAEEERAQRLCEGVAIPANSQAEPPVAVSPGSLMSAADRVLAARLVIGVDSGLTHLAAVLGRPTIGLYGATSAERTGVRGPQALDLISNFECAPCLQKECSYGGKLPRLNDQPLVPACFSKLPAEQILHAAEELLAR